MTTTERVLVALFNGPLTAGEVGSAAIDNRRGRISSVNGGGDYAAQMLLGRLRKAGLAFTISMSEPGASRWALTADGRRRARALRRRTL